MTNAELISMYDTLQGNVNRIIVTDNKAEMDAMFISAITKLNTIYVENQKRLLGDLK